MWNLGDQGVSTVTNLLVASFVARQTSQGEFGSFALAMSIYILTVLLARAVCGQTLLIAFAREQPADERKAMAESFLGLGLVIGVIGAAAYCVTALFTSAGLQQDSLALAVVVAPTVVQDVARFLFLGLGRPRTAFASDTVWLVVQLLLTFTALSLSSASSAREPLWAWGLGGFAAAGYAVFQLRILPKPMAGVRIFLANRRRCVQFALELLALSGGTQLLLYAVAVVAGRTEVAGLRGAAVLFGPVTLIFTAARSGLLAHVAGTAERARERLTIDCARISMALGAVMFILGAALIFLPRGVGEPILGSTWSVTQPLLPAFGLQFVILAIAEGPGIGLRALGESRRLLRIAIQYAGLSLFLGVVGAYLFGAAGAAWGNAVSAVLVLFGNIFALRAGVDRSEIRPATRDERI